MNSLIPLIAGIVMLGVTWFLLKIFIVWLKNETVKKSFAYFLGIVGVVIMILSLVNEAYSFFGYGLFSLIFGWRLDTLNLKKAEVKKVARGLGVCISILVLIAIIGTVIN